MSALERLHVLLPSLGLNETETVVEAHLDRLLHHSTTVNIRGESYRLKDRRKAGLVPSRRGGKRRPPTRSVRDRTSVRKGRRTSLGTVTTGEGTTRGER